MIFRRLMMVAMVCVILYTVTWAMDYADIQAPGNDVAVVIASVNAPILALMGYAMNLFNNKEST